VGQTMLTPAAAPPQLLRPGSAAGGEPKAGTKNVHNGRDLPLEFAGLVVPCAGGLRCKRGSEREVR
jgi:hypothetical protein